LDQTITVRFGAGTHLIKSPIGSGKSFLFFDAPVFGLYKTATRPIVNRHADRAKIDLLIDVAGELWTIRREIVTTTRGGESVKSQLYRVKNDEEALFELLHDELPEIVNYQK
jgi:DNA repair exonuclease SbcCD ATPase subunit